MPSPKQPRFIVVLSTAGSLKEGRRLAQQILSSKLAACVNLVPKAESHYWWKGKREQTSEVLLVIKTQRSNLKPLSGLIKTSHSYDVPEILALPVFWGDPAYLSWLSTHS